MNILSSIFLYFFPKPTVADIMVNFQEQQDALKALAVDYRDQDAALQQSIDNMIDQQQDLRDETNKAMRVVAKLDEFLT